MDTAPNHWEKLYANLYGSMGTNGHDVGFEDNGYDVYYPPSTTGLAEIEALVHSPVPTNFTHQAVLDDASYDANAYLAQGLVSSSQRQQVNEQLHINTQLSPYQFNDSDSSTASTSSFPPVLHTPYSQLYPRLPSSIDISPPSSASIESGMLMPEPLAEKPFPASPMSHCSPSFEGVFDDSAPHLPTETDVVTRVQMPHILEWKRVIEQCGTNDFVPQAVYQPYTEADRKRYIRDVTLQETIFFQSEGPSELGVSLDDALKQKIKRLANKEDRMFVGCGPSVSIRIQWPGYPSWSKQIPTMDFKTPKGHITRAKLAKNIAACVRRFAEAAQHKPMEADSDSRWKIGPRHIKVEDLVLVSLHHVSKGSWQPQLRFRSGPPAFPYQ